MALTIHPDQNQGSRYVREAVDCPTHSESEGGRLIAPSITPHWDNFLFQAVQPFASLTTCGCESPSAASLSASVLASSVLLACGMTGSTRVKTPDEVYFEMLQSRTCLASPGEVLREESSVVKILKVKHTFSLTGGDLARVMQVSRATIYNWLDETHAMKPNHERRLENLVLLSDFWEGQFDKPVGRVKALSRAQKDRLIEALVKEDLSDAEALISELKVASASSGKQKKTVLELLAENKFEPLPEGVSKTAIRSRLPSVNPLSDQD